LTCWQELHTQFLDLVKKGVEENRIIPDAALLGLDDNAGCIKVMFSFDRRVRAVELLQSKDFDA
jgi:hypothetical protein